MSILDCGDNSCEFAENKTGMRTNGGCRCLKDLPFDRRMAARGYIKDLKARLAEAIRYLEDGHCTYAAQGPVCPNDHVTAECDVCRTVKVWKEGE